MSAHNESPYYFVPHPSRHPISAALGLLVMLGSLALWINGHGWAPITMVLGLLWVLFVLYHWFGDAISESEGGMYGQRVEKSYRWSMSWFIFSEVMFFGAFFGALFYAREIAMHQLGSLDYRLIWPDFSAVWPNEGPVAGADHQYRAAADLGRDADGVAPCAARGSPAQGDRLAGGHHRARRLVPVPAGLRIFSCVPRTESDAGLGRLRLDVLPADGRAFTGFTCFSAARC
ncbi:MAG: Cytochrome c oxidase subunit 3 [Burkholderia plantarii]|nr:MAG: Cytochrome c oxidase subunit 3 [Burkholderia plantarii]